MNWNVVTPLRIVSYPHLSYLPQIVAEQLDLYADAGVDVEFLYSEQRPAGERLNEAMERDEVDLVVGNIWESLRSWGTGCEYVPVAHMVQQTRWIVVGREPSDGSADGYARLRGGRLLFPGDLATVWVAFREAMSKQGSPLDALEPMVERRPQQQVEREFRSGSGDLLVTDVETAVVAKFHEVTAIADHLGPVPWSVFMTLRKKVDARYEELTSFRHVVGRALTWIREHDAPEIAEHVQHRFSHHSMDDIVRMVQRYKTLGAGEWADTPWFDESNVSDWQDALVRWGLLAQPAPLDEVLEFNGLPRRDGDEGRRALRAG